MYQLLHHDEAYEGWVYETKTGPVVVEKLENFPYVRVRKRQSWFRRMLNGDQSFKIPFYYLYSEDL